jgi:O-6-methylguanine DNA methyltransferase
MSFRERVYRETSRIPRGRVATYSYIAGRAGSPRAVRAVGNILNRNPNPGRVPCHRVVRSDRTPGGFSKGASKKTGLLREEGIPTENGRIPERFFL